MPKRRGKARLLIQIFQDKSKQLYVAECLSYTQSVKIIFESEASAAHRDTQLEAWQCYCLFRLR